MGAYKGMYVIEAGDVVSGKMATAFMKHGGKNIPCSWFTYFEGTCRKKKNEAPRLGTTSLMKRSMGWSGSGKVRMYYANSFFRKMAQDYAKNGKDVFVDIVVTNDDPSTTLGAQAVMFKNVNFDDIPLAKFDVEGDAPLSEEMTFSFDDFELLESFQHPAAADYQP